jgi:hypothetical protein
MLFDGLSMSFTMLEFIYTIPGLAPSLHAPTTMSNAGLLPYAFWACEF